MTSASPSAAPADANGNQTSVTVSPTTLPGGGTVSVAPTGEVTINTTAGTTLGNYTITVSVNGTLRISFTLTATQVTTLAGGTRVGLYWSSGSTIRFSNILATQPASP